MLIDFTVKNFRSIKEPVTLSMLATNLKEHSENTFETPNEKQIKLLKTAVVYGANASGKSNLLKAIQVLKDFVVNSTDLKLGAKIKYYDPFKLEKNYANAPTEFEIEFVGNDKIRYRYEIAFNGTEVLRESLVFFPKGQEANLFKREKGKSINFGDYYKGARKTIENQLLENNLFLSKAANSKNEMLGEIYKFLNVSVPFYDLRAIPTAKRFTIDNFNKNNDTYSKLIELFKIADFGIEKFNIEEEPISEDILDKIFSNSNNFAKGIPKDVISEMKKDYEQGELKKFRSNKVRTNHLIFSGSEKVGITSFDLENESLGTQRFFGMSGLILAVLNSGASLIADELNNSLHPLMTQFLIKLFNNPETNPKNAQLIFATHDATLLSNEIFRRDQIWFTEKDGFGATNLYSLSEFDKNEVRSTTPFDKWYLSGRFGGLPLIQDSKLWEKDAEKEKE